MNRIFTLMTLLITSLFTFGQSRAQKIDSICQVIKNKNTEVSISIGFIDNGKEYFFNYGKISPKSDLKVNKNTVYEIGSITKLLTANLIIQAQEEGKLNINDFIDEYLPAGYVLSEDIKEKLKISDLASHQSGLPDFDFGKLIKSNPKQPLDIDKEIIHSIINNSTKLTDYGNYRYSNISYVLMGIILENIYSKSFEKLVREKILGPSNMNNTLTTNFDIKNKVIGHNVNGDQQDFLVWNTLFASAGLLKSNTSDMSKLLKIFLTNKGSIGRATLETEKTFYKNTQIEIGFGQEIERNGNDIFFYKAGDTLSCSSIFVYNKKSNWGIIIMINHKNSDLIRELINTIYKYALN